MTLPLVEAKQNQYPNQHQGSNLGADSGADMVDWEERKNTIMEVLRINPKISRVATAKETGLTERQAEMCSTNIDQISN